MTTAGEQINGALRLLGVLAEGETPSAETSQDALSAFDLARPGVYAITNVLNKSVYVGSAVNIKNRWRKHIHLLRRGLHHSPFLQNAYNKHGIKAFTLDVIEFVDDKTRLPEREQTWIDFFTPRYNLSPTAYSCYGYKHTPEARAKMSASQTGKRHLFCAVVKRKRALKGHVVTPETKAKISRSHLGIRPSAEARAKMSAAKKGRPQSPETIAKRMAAIRAARLARHTGAT